MKKRLLRRSFASRKLVSKKTSKTRFSFRFWILSALTLVLTLAVGYIFLKPKTQGELVFTDTLNGYLTPAPVDINIVLSGKYASLPKSDIPEAYAAAVTNQYVNQQEAKAKAKGEEYKPDEETLNKVASQALTQAYQDSAAAGAISASEAIVIVNGKNQEGSQFNQELDKVQQIIEDILIQNEEVPPTNPSTDNSANQPHQAVMQLVLSSVDDSPLPPVDIPDSPSNTSAEPTTYLEDSWIQSQAECHEARGRWSELLSECITGVVIVPPTTDAADSTTPTSNYPEHPYIDFEKRASDCKALKGTYDPSIDHCRLPAGGWYDDWVDVIRHERACEWFKGAYIPDGGPGQCKLPAGGSLDNYFLPYFIPTNLDYSDPVNQGVLGETADNVAYSVSRCQRNDWGSGDDLYNCLCALIDCRPGSAGQDIAIYLATNSQDANGVSDMDLVNAIVGKTTDNNSLVCGSTASDVGKSCLPKEPTGWYACENPTELYADDIVVIQGDHYANTSEEDIAGICTDAVGSATCNVADSGYYESSLTPNYVDIHPISVGEVDRVIRKLPDGDRRSAGCWASNSIQVEDYVAPDR